MAACSPSMVVKSAPSGGGITDPLMVMIPIFTALPTTMPDITAKMFFKIGFMYVMFGLIRVIMKLVNKVKALTNGKGVAAVYDSVGKDTFYPSLDCLQPHGVMVTYGNATGAVEPFPVLELASRGSLFVTRPVLNDFIKARQDLIDAADELFTLISNKVIRVHLNTIMPLADVAEAHVNLESRSTTGSTILKP